jgi:hypothetical protein
VDRRPQTLAHRPVELLAASLTRRWRVPRAVPARLLGVAVPALAPAIRQADYGLDQLEHTAPRAAISATTAQQLAAIAGARAVRAVFVLPFAPRCAVGT